jgi:hypothetical protein
LFYLPQRKDAKDIINKIRGKIKGKNGEKDENLRKDAIKYFLNRLDDSNKA